MLRHACSVVLASQRSQGWRLAAPKISRESTRLQVQAPRQLSYVAPSSDGKPLIQVPDHVPAMVVTEKGSKLQRIDHVPAPLRPSDIDIQVTHNGLCHTDVHIHEGHEVVGIVAAKGSEVTGLEMGDRVGYAWIKDSCGCCPHCIRGEENICLKGYTGTITNGGNGGWQRFMRAPAKFAFKIPDALDSASAAPLLCAGVTVYAPLRRLVTHPGSKVAVIGIGGLGHLALQFANAMGAEVTAISTSPNKEEEARSFGAHNFACGSEAMEKLAGTQELIINTVSSKNDYTEQMKLLRPDGTLCLVGLPVDNVTVSVLDVVFNQKKVVGSIVGGRRDMAEMLEFAALQGIRPKIEVMPLSHVNEAIEKLVANKARYRIVLETDL